MPAGFGIPFKKLSFLKALYNSRPTAINQFGLFWDLKLSAGSYKCQPIVFRAEQFLLLNKPLLKLQKKISLLRTFLSQYWCYVTKRLDSILYWTFNVRKRKSYFNCTSLLFKTAHHITISNLFIPFMANVLILQPLKRTEKLWFSGVFRGYKMGTKSN